MRPKVQVALSWEEWTVVCGALMVVARSLDGCPLGNNMLGLAFEITAQTAIVAASRTDETMSEAPSAE